MRLGASMTMVAGLVAAAGAQKPSLPSQSWATVTTPVFRVDLPVTWKKVRSSWNQAARTGDFKWQSLNRNWRLTVRVEPAPRGDLAGHVDKALRGSLLPGIAKWKQTTRQVLEVDGRKVVFVFGHGLMRRNKTVRPHGIAVAAYRARRGLLATVSIVSSQKRIAHFEGALERILESTAWIDAAVAPAKKAAPKKKGGAR